MTISITDIVMVMKTQLKVTYLPLIPSWPLFVTTNDLLLALRGQKPSPDLGNLTIMRLVHGMITGQMQEWLLRT